MLQLHIYTTFQMFVYVHFHACRRLKYTYTQAFTETQIAPSLPSQTHNMNHHRSYQDLRQGEEVTNNSSRIET